MKLTKRQKVASAILVVVLGALIVDRTYLSPGKVSAEASASSSQTSSEPEIESIKQGVIPEPGSQSTTMKLVQRLETLWSEKSPDVRSMASAISRARDAFSLPEAWLAKVHPSGLARPEQDAVIRFTRNHQLKAVVVQGQTRCVMVDDNFLTIGQELDGFKLVAVDEESATFEAGEQRVILLLTNDR
jgi:hypothetical protein